MGSSARTAGLIDGIYAAALEPTRWPAFMESLASSLHAGFGTLWLHDFSEGATAADDGAVSAVTGLDPATVDQYKSYYSGTNVWLPHAAQLAEGNVTVSSLLFPDRLLKGTEFHDGFLRPNNLFYAVGSSILKQGTRDVKMSFVRPERAGRYSDTELRMVRQLMPHMRNAVVLHRELHRCKLLAASALAALELLPVGVILLSGSGRMMHANRRAHDLCERTAALRFKAGSLHAATAAATASLQRLVQESLQTSARKADTPGGMLQLVGAAGRRLQVLVTPLPADSSALGEGPMAAIFCGDPQAAIGVLSQTLEVLYRMTPAEARLTEALVNGQSLKEYAQSRDTTLNTVRTQLKEAVAKTGARRQADLVRIVLTGPAVFRPPNR